MSIESAQQGTLFVIATPIGNLEDITARALRILKEVDLIAAEDTRHSAILLQHFAINTPLKACHNHNERQQCDYFIEQLQQGKHIALISDAGTPLISDPGFHLVKQAHAHHIKVVPVPGACALIAALSAAGLPSDRFCFEGFLPAKATARKKVIETIKHESRTIVFHEAPHRLLESLQDLTDILGSDRHVTLARELTKTYETIIQLPLGDLVRWVADDQNQQRGECVLLVEGWQPPEQDCLDSEAQRILTILLAELSVKQAAALTSEITGLRRNQLYQEALEIAKKMHK